MAASQQQRELALLRRAAATGAWATAADWALRRALRAVGGLPAGPELRRLLLHALESEPGPAAVSAASAYDLLANAQHALLPGGRAEHMQASKDVRDAVILSCVLCIGTHSDPWQFDVACNDAFQRQVKQPAQLGPQDSLYAALHHSYQKLFEHVPGKFQSNCKLERRSRRPPRERGAPPAGRPEANEPEDESEVSAAESQTPRSSARGSAGGASPAAPGAEPPPGGGAPRVPAGLEVPEGWRRRVEDVLESIADPRTKAEVVHGCVERLKCRLKEVEGPCFHSAPGQQLCEHLLWELSHAVRRFPRESQLHTECRDVLLFMCRCRGDVLGLHAPDISQERARPVPLCPHTQRSVKEAVATAARTCSSEESREELTRLLVRTQPVAFVLEQVDTEGTGVLLDEAKHGLSWCFECMGRSEFRECSVAFLKEVMQHQDRTEFLSMHNWVQGGHAHSWHHMQDRFAVIGLLFGISSQIIAPLPKLQDAYMIVEALNALTFLDSITPFDTSTNAKLVQSIHDLGGKEKREQWVGVGLSDQWMQCEAKYVWWLGRLLRNTSQTRGPHVMVDWTVREACAIIDHAMSTTSDRHGPPALHAALWCLAEIFDGAWQRSPRSSGWDRTVADASRRALQYAARFESKSARESTDVAKRLVSLCYGEPRR